MATPRKYTYFEGLEKTIKISTTVCIFLLVVGITLIVAGAQNVFSMLAQARPEIILLIFLGFVGLSASLVYVINTTDFLRQSYQWIDRNFFGFLKKSNDTILESILYVVKPEERVRVGRLEPIMRDTIAQNILASLSSDEQIFDGLLGSGIFRTWTWYWVLVHLTLTFTLLTAVAFAAILLGDDGSAKDVFLIVWICALAALGFALAIGLRLPRMSKKQMDAIVSKHRDVISSRLSSVFEDSAEGPSED